MLTKEQKQFINKCEMTVGSQPYSEVLRLIDIIKELEKRVAFLENDNSYVCGDASTCRSVMHNCDNT